MTKKQPCDLLPNTPHFQKIVGEPGRGREKTVKDHSKPGRVDQQSVKLRDQDLTNLRTLFSKKVAKCPQKLCR